MWNSDNKFNQYILSHPKYSVTFTTYLLGTTSFKKIPNQVATETIKNIKTISFTHHSLHIYSFTHQSFTDQ